jgi:hypothetical protein
MFSRVQVFLSGAFGKEAGVAEHLKAYERVGYRAVLIAVSVVAVALVLILVLALTSG